MKMSELRCLPDEVNWNETEFTKEMLDYLRAVYSIHPMIIDLLDEFALLQKQAKELQERIDSLQEEM